MHKILVAYFSASGVTAALARRLALATGADVREIKPAVPYTTADLDWTDSASRSSIEMKDKSFRPALADDVSADCSAYDTVFVGFPIWWYVAPTLINSFLEKCDLHGKTVIPFATSGSSGMGRTSAELAPSCHGADVKEGKRFRASASAEELKAWADGFLKN